MSKLEQEVLRKRERDLRGLTQAFRESEERRRKVTEQVRVAKGGTPLAKPVKKVKPPFPVILDEHSRGIVVQELEQFGLEIATLSGMSKKMDDTIVNVNRQLKVLTDKIVTDLDERRKLRQKLSATIDDLDQYLKNWL